MKSFLGYSVRLLPPDQVLCKTQWLKSCCRDNRSQEESNLRPHFNHLSHVLGQTRIFHTQCFIGKEVREHSHSTLILIFPLSHLSLSLSLACPFFSIPLFHISVKTPKLYCSRKLKSCLPNFSLHVPASVAHGILFIPVIEGPRERKGDYRFLNCNFISFSIRPVFPLTSFLMLKSCYPNLDPSSNSICKTFEDLLNCSVKW